MTENVAFHVGSGGGIVNGGTMIIETSTIGGNSAGTSGGGIFNGGNLTLQGVTVAHNEVVGSFLMGLGGSHIRPAAIWRRRAYKGVHHRRWRHMERPIRHDSDRNVSYRRQ